MMANEAVVGGGSAGHRADVLYIALLTATERDHAVFLPTFGVIPTTSPSAWTLFVKSARRTSVIETRLPTFLGSLAPFNALLLLR